MVPGTKWIFSTYLLFWGNKLCRFCVSQFLPSEWCNEDKYHFTHMHNWIMNEKYQIKKKIWMMITGEKETVHSTPFILFEEFPCKCNGKEKPGPCFWPFGMWFNLSRRKIRPLRWYPHGPRFYSLEIKHMLLEK